MLITWKPTNSIHFLSLNFLLLFIYLHAFALAGGFSTWKPSAIAALSVTQLHYRNMSLYSSHTTRGRLRLRLPDTETFSPSHQVRFLFIMAPPSCQDRETSFMNLICIKLQRPLLAPPLSLLREATREHCASDAFFFGACFNSVLLTTLTHCCTKRTRNKDFFLLYLFIFRSSYLHFTLAKKNNQYL